MCRGPGGDPEQEEEASLSGWVTPARTPSCLGKWAQNCPQGSTIVTGTLWQRVGEGSVCGGQSGDAGHLPAWVEQQVQAWHGRGGEAGETGWGQIAGACEQGGGGGGIKVCTFSVDELLAASDFRGSHF